MLILKFKISETLKQDLKHLLIVSRSEHLSFWIEHSPHFIQPCTATASLGNYKGKLKLDKNCLEIFIPSSSCDSTLYSWEYVKTKKANSRETMIGSINGVYYEAVSYPDTVFYTGPWE